MTPEDFKERRDTLRLSQSELAATLGISVDTVQNWEQGRNTVPPYLEFVFDALDTGAPIKRSESASVSAADVLAEWSEDRIDPVRARQKEARRRARLEARYGLRYAERVQALQGEIDDSKAQDRLNHYLASRDINPIIHRVGGWAVTTFGIERLDDHYPISGDRIREQDWIEHLRKKATISRECLADFAQCLEYALTHEIAFSDPVPVPDEDEEAR